jgi:hypothetical protein
VRPEVALGVFHCGAQNFDAIGGTADIDRPPAPIASDENDPQRSSGRIRGTGFMECPRAVIGLLRLDVGGPDHLGPLLGISDDELAELGGPAKETSAHDRR